MLTLLIAWLRYHQLELQSRLLWKCLHHHSHYSIPDTPEEMSPIATLTAGEISCVFLTVLLKYQRRLAFPGFFASFASRAPLLSFLDS
jgi:hypothetical protein